MAALANRPARNRVPHTLEERFLEFQKTNFDVGGLFLTFPEQAPMRLFRVGTTFLTRDAFPLLFRWHRNAT